MAKGYPVVSKETQQLIIQRIKEKGERVPDLAKEYGIQPRNIYCWLSKLAGGSAPVLEIAKLKREHEALLKIVGQLMIENELSGKKNKNRF